MRPKPPANRAVTSEQQEAAKGLHARVAHLRIDFDEITGRPKLIASLGGFLTGADGLGRAVSDSTAKLLPPGETNRPIKLFLAEHRALFGHGPEALASARLNRDYETAHNGLRTAIWQQELGGIPVLDATLIANTTRLGELVNVCGGFLPNPVRVSETGVPDRNFRPGALAVSGAAAVALAAQNIGEPLDPDRTIAVGAATNGQERKRHFRSPALLDDAIAGLIWVPLDRDRVRLCWEVVLAGRTGGFMYRLLVDAQRGDVLLRHCLTHAISAASYRVFTSDSPMPFSPGYSTPQTNLPPMTNRLLVTLAALNTNASPAGWIPDGGNETLGNNVDAHSDLNGDLLPDLPRPQGSPARVFDFPMDLTTQDPTNYTAASVVQLFYLCNWMHDRLYELGFTEATGNFQSNNFGRGGLGNDAVNANAQDRSGMNNAYISVPSDGTPPRMRVFLADYPRQTQRRDIALDAEVVLHEYTHGLSWRLVGGGAALGASQSVALGEGWSDFYAMAMLSQPGDDVDGGYAQGAYSSLNYYAGWRRYPYTTDLAKNPLTFNDIDGLQADYCNSGAPTSVTCGTGNAGEAHNAGEVWCVALWEARASLIKSYGHAYGNQLMLQIVTDGMKLAPAYPNFIQARDAILLADRVDTGGANQTALWMAFAKRGMGYGATSPASSTCIGVIEAFDPLQELHITPAAPVVIRGPVGGPFAPSVFYYTLTNGDSAAIDWTVGAPSFVSVTPSFGTLLPGGPSITVTAQVVALPSVPEGVYPAMISFNNLYSGNTWTRQVTLRVGQPDYFTERFDTVTRTNDLAFQSILFTPDGSSSFYTACRQAVTGFYSDPTGGTVLNSSNSFSTSISLTNGSTVAIYNTRTNKVFVNPKGYLTLKGFDSILPYFGYSYYFGLPRVAGLFSANLNPYGGGTVSWKQLNNRLAVTYLAVPTYGSATETNSFQMEMFFDGRIRLTWLGLKIKDGMVGLSAGAGVPANFEPSDLSSYGSCAPLTIEVPAKVSEGTGVQSGAGAVWLASVLPTNLVVSLSSSAPGRLVVPATTTIVAGQRSNLFNLTVTDNAIADGDTNVVVSVSAPGYPNAAGVVRVIDDDLVLAITAQPQSVVTTVGSNASFQVTATGKLPVTYSWRRNGLIIPGATNAVYSTNTFQLGDSGAVFTCLLSNALGTLLSSDASLLVVNGPVELINFDELPNDYFGSEFTNSFHLLAWTNFYYVNGLTFPYRSGFALATISASNIAGGGYLSPASISYPDGFDFLSAYVTAAYRDNLELVTKAYTGNTLIYQKTNLLSATGANAINFGYQNVTRVEFLTSGGTPHSGYDDTGPEFLMDNLTVKIPAPLAPIITSHPANQAVVSGNGAAFSVSAIGQGVLSYQWRKDGTNLVGRTNAVLSLSNATNSDAGNYSVLVANANGSVLSATANLFVYSLPSNFRNTNTITIPVAGTADIYPSALSVVGVTGRVAYVSVTLSNLHHPYPADLDILLVDPSGNNRVLLMSDVGYGGAIHGVSLTFDERSSNVLPQNAQLVSGTYKPTDYGSGDVFPLPASVGPYVPSLGGLHGYNPNGTWLLFVSSDSPFSFGSGGSLSNGWSLSFTTVPFVPPVMLQPQLIGDQVQVRFETVVGQIYSLQYKNALPAASWLPLQSDLPGTGQTMGITVPATNSLRFYRVTSP